MSEFKRFHPLVNLVYFVFAIGFSSVFLNPVCLFVSVVGSIGFMLAANGKSKRNLWLFFAIFILTALFNPVFNHRGITIITFLPGGNPLTLESIVYGFASGGMLVSVIAYFASFNEIMTSDKYIYLFGKIAPALSLILSMTLRFVPRFIKELKNVSTAQKGIGKNTGKGRMKDKIKNAFSVLSVTVTWALENAIETSDSMKARGYGLKGRSSFSVFKFTKKDGFVLLAMLLFGIYTMIGGITGALSYEYFPSFKGTMLTAYGLSVYVSYLVIMTMPLLIEAVEVMRWNALKSKI